MNSNRIYVVLIVFLFLLLRIPGLGSDVSNSDSARWHRRSERFLSALKSGDFKSTYQHYQPGVTIMWIDAFVNQVAFTYQFRSTGEPKTLENSDHYPFVHGIAKSTDANKRYFLFSLLNQTNRANKEVKEK